MQLYVIDEVEEGRNHNRGEKLTSLSPTLSRHPISNGCAAYYGVRFRNARLAVGVEGIPKTRSGGYYYWSDSISFTIGLGDQFDDGNNRTIERCIQQRLII